MSRISIVSGWTNPGGSTVHFIELCNLLNDNGFDCTFYGPHSWHLDKCKSGTPSDVSLIDDDVLITHYVRVRNRVRKHILSCHETNMFPLKDMDLQCYDTIHYVSDFQRKWHSVDHPSVVIPPVVNKVKWKDPKNNTAGIIGSIDCHKQTHLSIERAIKDGRSKVILFGTINDAKYFNESVMPFLDDPDYVFVAGHIDDKEEMYSKVSVVYHSSKRETYGLVEAECKLAGIPFNGPSNHQDILDKDEILEKWTNVLK
tara:strand:- start:1484 stop:2254 length:771 start_codon:yes stop_codon:yes gene_type:complete